MIYVYINSPMQVFTIHHNVACSEIQKNRVQGQRFIIINNETMDNERRRFRRKFYRFNAQQHLNDMWLRIDFANPETEEAIAFEIKNLIGMNYIRVQRAVPTRHC